MKIPSRIKVGIHTYTVEQTKTGDTERGKGNWGLTDHQNHKILLDKDLPESRKNETFVHELLHIATCQSGLLDELSRDEHKKYSEEEIVNRMAPFVADIIENNKIQ